MAYTISKENGTNFATHELITLESPIAESNGQDMEKMGVDGIPGQVAEKWRGTQSDKHDMAVLGKKQELRRNFKFINILGLSSTAMASWEILLPLFAYSLEDGGTADMFWGFIVGTFGMSLVYASIAEMASISPTSGGQYHWVSEFAPPKIQKFFSYLVGWLSAIGWQLYLAGVCFVVALIIQGLIALNIEDYIRQSYHGTLLTIAVLAFSVIFNTSISSHLPMIESVMLVLHVFGMLAITIPIWILTPNLSHASEVLLTFTNEGSWPSRGLSAMIGLTVPFGALVGFDCSIHMSEEIQDASITIPRAIMWSIVPNAAMAFFMILTLIFCIGDVDSILDSKTGEPFIQLLYNSTQSYTATNIMVTLIIILLLSCCVSEVATTSRQIWSFARDQGLPASGWLSKISPGWNIPLRAVCVSIVVSCLLSLINLGSAFALNAINSLGVVSILSSYYITISCLIWRRTQGPLPNRRWSLGKYGMAINIGALMFLTPFWFFAFWPLTLPVTLENMNWSSVMFVGAFSISLIYYYFKARHVYKGPMVLVKRDE
ncbi:putative amino acid transporter protein [Botrytis fragariae]|uniref:Putative amino acid transporter protein n=1 Tax=Botrytis fragariae TaxID=1964551 RepID=A0A8H6AJF5_9HELO|nr:putative amino acid transporter protein [Botrytis fragariae]KAF5868527.1 putative amino acid transporter protein [Botrytis fragariae]